MTLASSWKTNLIIRGWKTLFHDTLASSGITVFYEPPPTPKSTEGLMKWVVLKAEGESGRITGSLKVGLDYTVIACTRKDNDSMILQGLRNDIIDAATLNGDGIKSVVFDTATDCFDILFNGIGVNSQFVDGTKFLELNFTLRWTR